jgi:hypothetical protein
MTNENITNWESDTRLSDLPVDNNVPPTIIIDWLFYNIFMYVLL